ncbi:helix-turn-helix domain-containing protein [Patescibacteria group bacterium]|nr:helix-turn-helix domain-containing protein [Patescibacteria group bacterium]
MYETTLKNLGLNQNEAEIYEILLELGPSTLQVLKGKKTDLSRGNIYNTFYSLRNKGLVVELKHKKKTIFQAETPDKLMDLLVRKEEGFLQDKKIWRIFCQI